jgi:hypothetical protein
MIVAQTDKTFRRHQLDPERAQIVVPRDLHTEVARKPVGALDENHAHAVASDAVEHGLEARSLGHRVGAAHRRVVELCRAIMVQAFFERKTGQAP